MKLTLIAFLSFLLGVALTLIVLELLGVDFHPDTPLIGASCVNEKRYTPADGGIAAEAIDQGSFQTMKDAFYTRVYGGAAPAPGDAVPQANRTGFFLSKIVMDTIFNNSFYANGVMCELGWQEPGGLQVLVTPSVQNDIRVNAIQDNYNFLIKSWCPPKCSNVRDPQMGRPIGATD